MTCLIDHLDVHEHRLGLRLLDHLDVHEHRLGLRLLDHLDVHVERILFFHVRLSVKTRDQARHPPQ